MALQTSYGQLTITSSKNRAVERTEASQVPQAVIDGGKGSTMLRVNNLGQQHWRGQLTERVAESENETTSTEHWR